MDEERLYEKFEEMEVQFAEIKTMLTNVIDVTMKSHAERLDRHRQDINRAFDEIEELKTTIETTKGKFITTKNILIGLLGLVATCTTIAVGVTQLFISGK